MFTPAEAGVVLDPGETTTCLRWLQAVYGFDCRLDNGGGEWNVLPMNIDIERPWIMSFDGIIGGYDRVVYARTTLVSPKAQDARLDFGSDDGVKAWLNGEVVHNNHASRSTNPGDDKVAVKLKKGKNLLLIKVNQGRGGWSACLQVRTSDGNPATSVRAKV